MELTLPSLIDEFIATKQIEGRSAKTLSWYRWLLTKFADSLADTRLPNFTLTTARDFVAGLQARTTRFEGHPISPVKEGGLSVHTISAYVRTLKVFSKWLSEEGLTKTDVLARLKRPKLPEKVIEVLSDGEINTLLGCINPDTYIGSRNYAIVMLLLDTGLRASELCGLKLANTDLADSRLKVLGKGNKERFVPLGVRAKKALMVYLSRFRPKDTGHDEVFLSEDGQPLSYNGLKLIVARLAKKSGIPRLHLHLLRHTYAVKYLINGGDQVSLRMNLGHTSLVTTEMYLKLSMEHRALQHQRFSPMDRLEITTDKHRAKAAKTR